MLALPVLAGSSAYALGETLGWNVGLAKKPHRAKAFYSTIAVPTLVGVALNFTPIDPIKTLFWSAVINGVVAVPVMGMMMHLSGKRAAMGDFQLPTGLKIVGWLATAVMAVAAVGLFATWWCELANDSVGRTLEWSLLGIGTDLQMAISGDHSASPAHAPAGGLFV
ncbi:divalent metal cation transporter [Mesorhizobium carmichaelinearum]|uniref:divalent metal cation transporter n=1 Tax=Mesorhizobium carmichaelinearum TaxID=1208188 RepID=UPI002452F00B|nr:divalent metal cation transporter [Mesorhizobium carmichaelinearum]